MEIRSILSKNIKRLRKEQGYSQEALADVCGMHRTYISGIERGERNPTVTVVAKIAKGLKVQASVLLEK
jgi:transcriptional regulator with XRE-family HTH domain